MAVSNNEYFKNYLKSMNDPKLSMDEKFKITSDYNRKYLDERDTNNIAYKFMRDNLRIELSIGMPDEPQFEAEEFVKALSIINSTEKGNVKFLYFLNVLMKASEDILPVYPEEFMVKLKQLEKSMDLIIKYGIDHDMIKIDEKDMDLISKVSVDHTEAAMEVEEESDKEESKKVEKETSKDKKEEDKKKKEEKKKKNEENRNTTKKWFDYDSLDNLHDEIKKNKSVFYKVANRIAALLVQEEVQKIIGDEKFKGLVYQNTDDFAIINESNTRVFWFKKGEVEHFTDTSVFNLKWGEAHQPTELKFTA